MFHSKALTKAISELDPHTANFKDKADQVSNDIRALEKYLNDKFIGTEIGLNVQDHKIDDEHMKLFELAGMDKVIWPRFGGHHFMRLLIF